MACDGSKRMYRFRIPQLLRLHDHGHGRDDGDDDDVHARHDRGHGHRGHDEDAHVRLPRHDRHDRDDGDDVHVLLLHHLLHALRFFLIQSPESNRLKWLRFPNQTSWC